MSTTSCECIVAIRYRNIWCGVSTTNVLIGGDFGKARILDPASGGTVEMKAFGRNVLIICVNPAHSQDPGSSWGVQLEWDDKKNTLGTEGESRAAQYLTRRGYRIAARNVRAGGVEIDLVATRGRLVAFVEVKTRRSARFGRPEEAVDAAKRARLIRGAAAWLREHPQRERRVRFDVIALQSRGPDAWDIRHFEGAFDAGD